MDRLSNILIKIFHYMFLILMAFLFVCSVFVTATHEHYENGSVQEFAKVTLNNVPLTVGLFLLGLAVVLLITRITDFCLKKHDINTRVPALIVSILAAVLAILWINKTDIIPGADQAFCVQYASAINNGDYSAFEKGHYLSNYPHLWGTIAILRLLYKLFGDGNYDAFRYFTACTLPVLVYSGYKVTSILSEGNKKAEIFYLMAMLFNFPMYSYVLFVYGDLAGPAFGLLSLWMFLECLEKPNACKVVIFALSMFLAFALRKNVAIYAIAMLGVLVLRMIKKFKLKDLLLLVLIVASILFNTSIVKLFFLPEKLDESNSVPAAACIAMGFNWDNGYAGWYNYYELNIFAENDSDSDKASEAALNDIKSVYIPLYVHNPKYCLEFFFNKINSQWQSPMYQGIVTNNLLYGAQNDFVMSVYTGTFGKIFDTFMKAYQMLMYFFLTVLLFTNRKRNLPFSWYTPLIAVFGGFILSMFWEAKGRYILTYFFLLIPFFAMGAVKGFDMVSHLMQTKKSDLVTDI